MELLKLWKKWQGAPDSDNDQPGEETEHLQRALERIEQDSIRYKQSVTKPWLGKNGEVLWSKNRICLAKFVVSQSFETFMGLVIFANLVLTIVETNSVAACYPDYAQQLETCPQRTSAQSWLLVCTIVFQVVYTMECALRAYVDRNNFLWNKWNQIDLWITILGWVGVALSSLVHLNILRILRVVRLARVGRLVISVPELYILLSGLTTSFKPILFGSIMLISVILVWSVVVVELLHPIASQLDFRNCPNCHMGFSGVYTAWLTLFSQIVAGDSWGLISLPLAKAEPWTTPILFFIMMTVSLGVMNLILAVIVEKAAEARENDQERKLKQADQQRQKDMVELAVLCDRMDNDGSGALSLQEMLDGFDYDLDFQKVMARMDIERSEVETLFKALDADASGELDFLEFCYHLGSCKRRDPLMLSALTRYGVMEVKTLIHSEVSKALEEQRQMLQDQLELLSHIPSCEHAAKELRQKRLEKACDGSDSGQHGKHGKHVGNDESAKPVPKQHARRTQHQHQVQRIQKLRATVREHRQSLKATEETGETEQQMSQTLPVGSIGLTVQPAERLGSLRSVETISDSLLASCKFYETMQSQLESLMLTIEQLRADAPQEPAASLKPSSPVGHEPESATQVMRVTQVTPDAIEVDSRYDELQREEEALHAKCRSLINSIALSLGEPHVAREHVRV